MKLGIILNPAAGRGTALKKLPDLEKHLKGRGVSYELHLTERPGHARELASQLAERDDVFSVVAAGGDGTVNEVGWGLLHKNKPLFVIPFGTGNDYSKAVHDEDRDWKKVIDKVLKTRKIKFVDVCMVEEEHQTRPVFNGFGMGFDAHVASIIRKIPLLKGDLLYIVGVIKSFFSFTPPHLTIRTGKKILSEQFHICSVGCGQFMGGGFHLFPHASLTDGLIDIDLIRKVKTSVFLKKMWLVLKGTHLNEPEVIYFQTPDDVHIVSDRPVYYHLDGEVSPQPVREVKIKILKKALPVLI